MTSKHQSLLRFDLTSTNTVAIAGAGPEETTVRRLLNLGETRVNGVDPDVRHRFSPGGVCVNFGALATYTTKYLYQLKKGGTLINGAGNLSLLETPKLRGTATASYDKDDWSSFMDYNYTGGGDYNDPTVASGCYLASTGLTLA